MGWSAARGWMVGGCLARLLQGALWMGCVLGSAAAHTPDTLEWAVPDIAPVFFYANGKAPTVPGELGRGSGDAYLRAIMREMPEYQHRIVGMPYVRGWAEMERGRTLCMPVVLRAANRAPLGWFTPMAPLPPLNVVTRADRAADILGDGPTVSLAKLIERADLDGIIVAGRSFGPQVDELLRQPAAQQRIQAMRNADNQQAASMLMLGRADYWIEYPHVAEWQVRSLERRPPLAWKRIEEFSLDPPLHVACTRDEAGRKAVEAVDRAIRRAARQAPYRDASLNWYPPEVRQVAQERFYRWFDERAKRSVIE